MDDEDMLVAEGMEAEGPPEDWEARAEEDGMRRLQEAGLSWC